MGWRGSLCGGVFLRYAGAMLARAYSRLFVFAFVAAGATGCATGGVYAERDRSANLDSRGEANGTMFDMVSMTPDGDQWTIRLRGDNFWVANSLEDRKNDFGAVTLLPKESKKLWKLINAVDIPKRRKGIRDERNGDVLLRLREPSDDGDEHKIYSAYISRATEVESIVELGDYMRDLIQKYHKEKPVF
jgi:hypothetical protein